MPRYLNKRRLRVPGGELWFYPSGRITLWFGCRGYVLRKSRRTS